MNTRYAAALCFFLTMVTAQYTCAAATDESAKSALLLTQILDGTDALTQASDFSAENRTVSAVVDGSPEDAKKFCSDISAIVEKYELVFSEGWTAQLMSTDSDGQVMAVCPL